MTGVYKIESKTNSKRCYIGSAINITIRWKRHLKDLRKNKHHSQKLQRHFNKYGESDLHFSILLGCEKEDLLKHEQFYLDSCNCYFNICRIAGSCLGVKISEETRKKMSLASMGRKTMLGRKTSEETKAKQSKALMGNKNGIKAMSSRNCRN